MNVPTAIWLAPMEGVLDYQLRAMITAYGGYDKAVTEFVRVTNTLLPRKVFARYCPELSQGGCTATGTPVLVQLLGQDPQVLAENACRAAEMGAPGVDLNFGCPAPTVNRHRGGAVLLDEPDLIGNIVACVRRALPPEVPLSVKMRLGFADRSMGLINAQAIEAAGAASLAVHARSRDDAYRPPAYWAELAPIRQALKIPVIANGDLWTPEDCAACQAQSQCEALMLGRAAVAAPDLAQRLKNGGAALTWRALLLALRSLDVGMSEEIAERYLPSRVKQWLKALARHHPEAAELFSVLRRLRRRDEVLALLDQSLAACGP